RHPKQMFKSLYMLFFQMPGVPEKLLSFNNYMAMKRVMKQTGNRNAFSEADMDEYEQAWSEEGALTAMLNWYRAAPAGLKSLEKRVMCLRRSYGESMMISYRKNLLKQALNCLMTVKSHGLKMRRTGSIMNSLKW